MIAEKQDVRSLADVLCAVDYSVFKSEDDIRHADLPEELKIGFIKDRKYNILLIAFGLAQCVDNETLKYWYDTYTYEGFKHPNNMFYQYFKKCFGVQHPENIFREVFKFAIDNYSQHFIGIRGKNQYESLERLVYKLAYRKNLPYLHITEEYEKELEEKDKKEVVKREPFMFNGQKVCKITYSDGTTEFDECYYYQ